MNDSELFTRLFYFGTAHLHMTADEFWLTPLGAFLDLWTCHKQWLGIEKPRVERSVDDIIPLNCF